MMIKIKKQFYILATIGMSVLSHAATRPNIVWIFSDDHSWQSIGAYGSRLASLNPTPTLDQLAKDGMRFDRSYVANAFCTPSRATLFTGKHSHKNGVFRLGDGKLFDHNQLQFQKLLKEHGYETAIVGKVHIPGAFQGFDYAELLPGQGTYKNPSFILNGKKNTSYEGYVTDIIMDLALDWLDKKHDPSKPFMLMIHNKAPHSSWLPAVRHMQKYADVEIPEPDSLFDDFSTRTTNPDQLTETIDNLRWIKLKIGKSFAKRNQFRARNVWYEKHKPTGKELTRFKYQTHMKDYLRCVWAVDENVARVLKYLDDHGLRENTLVMYSSDQGFFNGEHGLYNKEWMYEESYRAPLLARWPHHIKPGSVNTDLVQNIDLAETFLDAAGIPIPSEMQGCSLVPLMEGKTPKDWRTSLYYHYYSQMKNGIPLHEGVSTKRYKLIRFYGHDVANGEAWELYDRETDPSEMNNLYNSPEKAGIIKELKAELKRLKEEYQVTPEPSR